MAMQVASTLSNSAYHLFYNGITQNLGIQETLVGAYMAFKGKELFSSVQQNGQIGGSSFLANRQWSLLAGAAKLSGVALIGGGLNYLYSGISQLSQDVEYLWSYVTGSYPKGEYYLNKDSYSCLTEGRYTKCANSYEKDAKERWGEGILSFDASDPREKVLILGPHKDPGQTGPTRQYMEGHYDFLNEKFDLRYKIVDNPLQACHEIQRSLREHPLHRVIINVHGHPKLMQFGRPDNGFWYRFDPFITEDCFKGLPRDAKIILFSCSTGDPSVSPNIAEMIAWLSQREVIAPSETVDTRGAFFSQGTKNELLVDFKNVDGMVRDIDLFGDQPKKNITDEVEYNMCHRSERVPGREITRRIVPPFSTEPMGARILPHLPLKKVMRGAATVWGLAKGAASLVEYGGKGLGLIAGRISGSADLPLRMPAICFEKVGTLLNQVLDLPLCPVYWAYSRVVSRLKTH